MPQIGNLEVLIKANADQFRKELNDVNNRLGVMGKNAQTGTARTSASFSKLGIAVGIAATAVAYAVSKMITSSTKLAMSAIESENLVSVVFKNSTSEIVAWSDKLSSALGLNAYTLRKNAGVFYNIADALGVSNDNAMTLSKGLVQLSGDMASFYNISDEEAMVKLRAGITGETEPLKQLGIVVDDTTIKQTAYRLGIAKTGNELSNQEKVLARYMTIMEQTKTAQGDLARTIDSPANQLRILKSRIEQIATSLGAIFIPALNAILPYIQAFVTMIGRAVTAIGKLFNIAGIQAAGQSVSDSVSGIGDSADGSAASVGNLKKELAGLASFDEMNVLKAPESGGGGGGTGGSVGSGLDFKLPEMDITGINSKVDGIIEKFTWMKSEILRIWGNIVTDLGLDRVAYFWGTVLNDFNNATITWSPIITENVKKLMVSINRDAIQPYLAISKQMWFDYLASVQRMWDEQGANIANGVMEGINNLVTIFNLLWSKILEPIITPFLNAFREAWNTSLKGAVDSVVQFVGKLINLVLIIWNNVISPIVSWVITILGPIFTKLGDSFGNILRTVLSVVGYVVQGVMGALNGIITFLTGVFTGNWRGAWQGVVSIFTSIFNGILGVITSVVNGFIWILNKMIGDINSIKIGDKSMNIRTIGYVSLEKARGYSGAWATGGITNGASLATIGEAGKEAVLPLENNTGWMDDLAAKLNGNGGQPITIYLGGEKVYEKTIEYIKDKQMTTGINILGI